MTGGKSHCTAELGDLKHPEHGLPALPRDESKTVQRRKSPERPVDGLPSSGTIRTVINDQEWHAFSERVDCTLCPLQRRFRAGVRIERSGRPCAVQTYGVACRPQYAVPRLDFRRLAVAIAKDKEATSGLRNAELRGIENLCADVVTEILQLVDDMLVTLPVPKLNHVFQNNPTRFEFPSEIDD